MKGYHIYFIFIKVLIITQIVAVILKKQTKKSDFFILSDTAFKISAGLYLILFFLIQPLPGLDFGDILILRFSGLIILFDIDYTGLRRILSKYSPLLSKSLSPLEKLQELQSP
jgi:hypothetical protein